MNSQKIYDVIVVGSSPLSIIYAIEQLDIGKSVLLIESRNELGGAWRANMLADGARVEEACHLFEYYDDVYEFLSEKSGVIFEVLKPAPTKYFGNGRSRAYFNRSAVCKSFCRVLFLTLIVITVRRLNCWLPKKNQLFSSFPLNEPAWRKRLKFLWHYRIRGLGKYRGIMSPKEGVVSFIDGLIHRFESQGGKKMQGRVISVEKTGAVWLLKTMDDNEIETKKIAVSESVELKKVMIEGKKFSISPKYSDYWHVLVAISKEDIKKDLTYVHLPEDKLFHRITAVRCDEKYLKEKQLLNERFFLIQLRKSYDDLANLDLDIQLLVEELGLIEIASNVIIKSKFTGKFVMSRQDIAIDEILKNNDIVVINSIGDISRVVAEAIKKER